MQDDIFILIESYRRDFTIVEQVIADYFLNKKRPETIDKLARKLAVSKASITRFCKKIGLSNYKELIFLYKLSLVRETNELSVASAVTAVYHMLATRSDSIYSEKNVDTFCEYIHKHKIIHFFGKGFNSYAGMDFQFKFSRLGKHIGIICDGNSIMLSANFASKDELIIVSSLRGNDEEMIKAMRVAKQRQVPILLITANQHSPLIAFANATLFSASFTKEESLGNISPQIPILIQLDMVYERYIHIYSDAIKSWLAAEKILYK